MSATPEPGHDDSPVTCPRCQFDFVPTLSAPEPAAPLPIGAATEPGEPPTPQPLAEVRAGMPKRIGRFEVRRYLGEGSFGRMTRRSDAWSR